MKDIEFMKKYLEENLVKGRYLHTLGVVETAKSLAKIYGVDIKKAEIAALAHDIAKNLSPQELLEVIDKNNINLSFDEKNTRELWHSIVGPIVARTFWNRRWRNIKCYKMAYYRKRKYVKAW